MSPSAFFAAQAIARCRPEIVQLRGLAGEPLLTVIRYRVELTGPLSDVEAKAGKGRTSMEAAVLRPRDARKNLMLAAQIAAGDLCAPVRIRNMSASGAMIDGPALPDPGSRFVLRRLNLQINATAVWTRGGRCGVRLAGQVDIEEWISGVHKPMREASLGQLRVDEIQAAVRSGAMLPAASPAAESAAPDVTLLARLGAELAFLQQTLAAAAEQLSDDPHVLTKHGEALQEIDIAAACLAELATVAAAPDPEEAIACIAMHDLRTRMSGVPTLT